MSLSDQIPPEAFQSLLSSEEQTQAEEAVEQPEEVGHANEDADDQATTPPSVHVCTFLVKYSYYICVVVMVLFLLSRFHVFTGSGPDCVIPTGAHGRKELSLPGFHKIQVAVSSHVLITQADTQKVVVESYSDLVHDISTEVKAGEWSIALKHPYCKTHSHLNVHIHTPKLDRVLVAGEADVRLSFEDWDSPYNKTIISEGSGNTTVSLPAVSVLTTRVEGSGNLTLLGDAQVHTSDFAGSGALHAFELPTQNTTVVVTGSGMAEVAVNQTLDVRMMGSADVRYKGNPTVEKSGSGSGTVQRVV